MMEQNILLTEFAVDRQKFGDVFVSQVPQLAKHWTIALYFYIVFGDNDAIPFKHWIDEMSNFTNNVAKKQLKDKNTPDKRKAILYERLNRGIANYSTVTKLLKDKFKEEVEGAISPVIASLRYDENIGNTCVNSFINCLTYEILPEIASCLSEEGIKDKLINFYEIQIKNKANTINVKRKNELNNLTEVKRIKSLFYFKGVL